MIKESWTSTLGDREDHYFLDKEKKVYLFGYNPRYISNQKFNQIMEIISSVGKLEKPKFSLPNSKNQSWRTEPIKEITDLINKERVGTKFKPITPKFVAIKTAHLKTNQDFHYLISVGKDSKRRGGSFSKVFFGSLKVK